MPEPFHGWHENIPPLFSTVTYLQVPLFLKSKTRNYGSVPNPANNRPLCFIYTSAIQQVPKTFVGFFLGSDILWVLCTHGATHSSNFQYPDTKYRAVENLEIVHRSKDVSKHTSPKKSIPLGICILEASLKFPLDIIANSKGYDSKSSVHFPCLCVSVCLLCAHIHVWACIHVYVLVEARGQCMVSISIHLIFSFLLRQGLPLILQLP